MARRDWEVDYLPNRVWTRVPRAGLYELESCIEPIYGPPHHAVIYMAYGENPPADIAPASVLANLSGRSAALKARLPAGCWLRRDNLPGSINFICFGYLGR